jgi:hypothetical protein
VLRDNVTRRLLSLVQRQEGERRRSIAECGEADAFASAGRGVDQAARESRSFVHIGIAAAVWATATAVAVLCYSGRGIQIAETEE